MTPSCSRMMRLSSSFLVFSGTSPPSFSARKTISSCARATSAAGGAPRSSLTRRPAGELNSFCCRHVRVTPQEAGASSDAARSTVLVPRCAALLPGRDVAVLGVCGVDELLAELARCRLGHDATALEHYQHNGIVRTITLSNTINRT